MEGGREGPNIHLVDIGTPNNMHAEQAIAALGAGKHVACEKPLSLSLKDARLMKNAASRSRRYRTFVWYNYRRCPAVALAYQLVKEGRIGRIYHVRANYLQSWGQAKTPMSWRYQKKYAGSGAHGDLNAHIVDAVRFVTGQEITEICGAMAETFVPQRLVIEAAPKETARPRPRKPVLAKVDVDDAVAFLARLSGGAMASFEATRLATGHSNDNGFEINGELGALKFSFEDMNNLWYYDNREDPKIAGWKRILCTTAGSHPYAGAWWPEGHLLGYEHTFVNMVADMMAVLAGQEPIVPLPDFDDAYETQRVLEAALISAKNRAAIKMTEVK